VIYLLLLHASMKKKLFITLLLGGLLYCTPKIFGQGLCDVGGGGFSVQPSEGCAPLVVKIINNVNGTSIGYAVNYDGKSLTPSLIRNLPECDYSGAGNYIMLQSVNIGGNEYYHCEKVKVYETVRINASLTSCGGGKIKLALEDGRVLQAYDQVEINWGDNSKDIWNKGSSLTLEHNYATTTGNPIVKVKGTYNPGTACAAGLEQSIPVTFQQPQLKNIKIKSVEMKGNGSMELTYDGATSIATEILYSNDGSNFISAAKRTSGGTQFFRIANLSANNVYQIKLSSEDLCGGKQVTETVQSMVLNGSSSDEKNSISWNKFANNTDFQEYQLMRDGILIKTINDINEISYNDEDVQCGDNYEYSIVAIAKSSFQSTSAPLGLKTTIASPKAIDQAYITVLDDQLINITTVIPGAANKTYDLTIERAEAGSNTFKKIGTLYSQNEYQDMNVEADKTSYCYRMIYQNACNQKSPVSEPICSILLQNQSSVFNWTTEKPFLDVVKSYSMIQKGSLSASIETNILLQNTFVPKITGQSDPQYTFQVRADSENGNFQSFSNIISYKRDADIFVPTAFSPNEDGINDIFEVKVSMYKSFNMSILNRWGEVIFYSNDMAKGWDGMYKGKAMPVGSYTFNIEVVNNINQSVSKKGTFVLLK
jgi:gliding motility-associated-like protein